MWCLSQYFLNNKQILLIKSGVAAVGEVFNGAGVPGGRIEVSYRRNNWMDMLANMIALAVMVLLVTMFTSKANAADFADNLDLNTSDTVAFVSAAQLIDSVSKDAIALDHRYLKEVDLVDSLIHYKFTRKVGLGVRFDGTSQDDILEPTFFMGFRSRW